MNQKKKQENEIQFLRTDVSSKEVILKTNNEKSSNYRKQLIGKVLTLKTFNVKQTFTLK